VQDSWEDFKVVLSPLQKALRHMQESFDDASLHMNGVSAGTEGLRERLTS
jgi:hypothetical protein